MEENCDEAKHISNANMYQGSLRITNEHPRKMERPSATVLTDRRQKGREKCTMGATWDHGGYLPDGRQFENDQPVSLNPFDRVVSS